MAEASNNKQEISLGSAFDAVVRHGGTTVELKTDGTVIVKTGGNAIVYTNGDVKVRPVALQIGDPDAGGVFVGPSATDGKPLHAALRDEPQCLTFEEALKAAAEMRKQPGRENAHVPTLEELDKNLAPNVDKGALRGTFFNTREFPYGYYRATTPDGFRSAGVKHVFDGLQYRDHDQVRVRLVW